MDQILGSRDVRVTGDAVRTRTNNIATANVEAIPDADAIIKHTSFGLVKSTWLFPVEPRRIDAAMSARLRKGKQAKAETEDAVTDVYGEYQRWATRRRVEQLMEFSVEAARKRGPVDVDYFCPTEDYGLCGTRDEIYEDCMVVAKAIHRDVRTWALDSWVPGPQRFHDVYHYSILCRAASPVWEGYHPPSGCTWRGRLSIAATGQSATSHPLRPLRGGHCDEPRRPNCRPRPQEATPPPDRTHPW